MNKKVLKKTAILTILIIAHLFVVFSCNGFLFGYALAQYHNQLNSDSIQLEPLVRVLCAILEFPLVNLSRLLPYHPGTASGRVTAFVVLFSYLANSILWAIVIYWLFSRFIKSRQKTQCRQF